MGLIKGWLALVLAVAAATGAEHGCPFPGAAGEGHACAAEGTAAGGQADDVEALLQIAAAGGTRAAEAARAALGSATPQRHTAAGVGQSGPQARTSIQAFEQLSALLGNAAVGVSGAEKSGDTCATITWEAKMALPANAEAAGMAPPMVVGTEENMDPKLKELGLDFTGIWWMRDNPVPEELVSFAYSTANSTAYPVQIAMPNSRKGHWSWLNDIVGWLLVKFYSLYDPLEPALADFNSSTYGYIQTSLTDMPLVWVESWPFIYMNDNEWLRPSIFQPRSIIPDTNYTLTRIIMGDGTPHPVFWPIYLEKMKAWGTPGAKKMVSMNTDSSCQRMCEILLPCSICKLFC